MQLTCWGAARSVTGSMHFLMAAGRRVLLDCGLFQGSWDESFERNRNLPFTASDLDAVILTHAHLDHCGNLASLINSGYTGPIYCTPATRDLAIAMLRDAAHIQEADAEYINIRHRRQGEPANAVPLFTSADVERMTQQLGVTEVYRIHAECFNAEMRDLRLRGEDPFGLKRLRYIRQREASVAINDVIEPCIIIAGAGMCEGGRIRHHLAHCIENPKHLILIVSYQAVNTLGRRLADRETKVKIFGEEYKRRARVKILNGFSGHADASELIEWVACGINNLKQAFVVHGEEEQSLAFASKLSDLGVRNVAVPQRGETFVLDD